MEGRLEGGAAMAGMWQHMQDVCRTFVFKLSPGDMFVEARVCTLPGYAGSGHASFCKYTIQLQRPFLLRYYPDRGASGNDRIGEGSRVPFR